MKKASILIGVSIASMLALTGCGSESTNEKVETAQTVEKAVEKPEVQKSDTVKDDLLSYMNESMPSLAEQEAVVIALYDSVSGPNYTDDETMYNKILEEVIPKYGDFITNLEEVKVETEELRNIHENYIEAVNIQNSGFVTILSALEEQDLDKMNNPTINVPQYIPWSISILLNIVNGLIDLLGVQRKLLDML